MFSHNVTVICLGASLLFPSPVLAGAWTLPADQGQVIVTGTLSTANKEFDGSGSAQATPRHDKFELQSLIEYGATERLTLIASPSLQHVHIDGAGGGQRTGLGYFELGGRYRLMQGDAWVLSGQTTLRVPGTFDKTNPAAVGYTDPEIDARILAGRNFSVGAWPAFVDLQLAQRFRTGDPPNEFRADLTFGLRPAPQWLLLTQSFNVFSEGQGEPGSPSFAYHKLQTSVAYEMTPAWALQLGAFTTFAGRNALRESGIVLGTSYKF